MDERNTMSDELQRITLAYVEGCERGSGPTLEALVEMYPQYANELIDFAMNYYIAEELGDDDPVQSSIPQEDRDLERRVLEDAFTQIQYPPALTSLIARARERGYELPGLAVNLNLGIDVIAKLEQRLIESSSLPDQLFEWLGHALAVSLQQLQWFFAQPPATNPSANTFFYAAKQPVVGQQQTFAEAIRASRSMTPEQQRMWLATVGEDIMNDRPKKPPSQRRRR